ncbi:2'-5' RNA ligase family protein [Microbacterium sp. AK031]|uniref:2'-5' RNA ligase family protein n=1 Tax=Microbacterium sp. AK031 TaxID=2723076 RepID=UPI002168E686|nr:2'-5' RNA ligase family protein [Microbacterium sp. AK031]MCS3843693.1 2'-5' RNA ligase [Microbacterium sp. AK031]
MLRSLPASITHPHTEHVTLRGFNEPDRLDEVHAAVRTWAAAQHPIEITTEAIDTFPAPWQMVIARLARTASVVSAYATLTDALASTDFHRPDERALDDWTFHMSVVYAKTLDADAWSALERSVTREYVERPTEVISEAEFAWHSCGVEHHEVVPLG